MRTEVRTLIATNFDARPAAERVDAARARRHADSSEGAVRARPARTTCSRSSLRQRVPRTSWRECTASGAWRSLRGRRRTVEARGAADAAPDRLPMRKIRAQAAKMLGDLRYAAAAANLVPLLADSAPRVRFFAAEALGRMAHKPAAPPIVAMLAANDDKDVYLRHAGSLALSRIRRRRRDRRRCRALSRKGVRIAAVVALRRLRSAEVARFVADSDETDRARGRAGDQRRWVDRRRRCRRWRGSSRTSDSPQRAATAARDQRQPEGRIGGGAGTSGRVRCRYEPAAADARRGGGGDGRLADPSPMDRVDGIYHRSAASRATAAAAQAAVLRLMQASSDGRAGAQGRAGRSRRAARMRRAPRRSSWPSSGATRRSDVRVASLRALQALKVPNMDEVMKVAVADSDANVRRAALGILPSLRDERRRKGRRASSP